MSDVSIESLKAELTQKIAGVSGSFVGISRTAFSRINAAKYLPNFSTIAINETSDLETIRENFPVITLKSDFSILQMMRENDNSILAQKKVLKYLQSLPAPVHLSLQRMTPKVQARVDAQSFIPLVSSAQIRVPFENKWSFRNIATKLGMDIPKGELVYLADLSQKKFQLLQQTYGNDLVFQLSDYNIGGGRGTFFIHSQSEFEAFLSHVEETIDSGKKLEHLVVTQKVSGESASIIGCVTQYGVFTTQVQRQLIDIPEVSHLQGRSGVFCGHEWGDFYSDAIHRGASEQTQILGQYLYEQGYLGVFGIDLVVDPESEHVSVIECNSRFTGAYPMLSMLQERAGMIPFEVWHFLEHLKLEYHINFEAIQNTYKKPLQGSQLVLHNLEETRVEVTKTVRCGIYRFDGSDIYFVRNGYSLDDLRDQDEFIFTEAVPMAGSIVRPGRRIGRFMFPNTITRSGKSQLTATYQNIVKKMYASFGFKAVTPG